MNSKEEVLKELEEEMGSSPLFDLLAPDLADLLEAIFNFKQKVESQGKAIKLMDDRILALEKEISILRKNEKVN